MSQRIDLSALPLPDLLEPLSFEAELALLKADLINRLPAVADALDLESEPVTKLLEVLAYRLVLKTGEINAKAKALLLAYATGSDLDHLGANADVYRLVIHPANPNSVPPTAAVLESDVDFRRRIQLAAERDAAGSVGAYQYWSLSASGDVRDVAVVAPAPGMVDVWVQSHSAAVAPASLLDAVATALDPDTRRPLTDLVSVQAATPQPVSVVAELTLYPGPDKAVILAAATAGLDRYSQLVRSLGYDVTISGLHAALHVAGVQRVRLVQPVMDIQIPPSRYAVITAQVSTVEYRDV